MSSGNSTIPAGVSSASALVSTLASSTLLAVICFGTFLLLRPRYDRIYESRLYHVFLHDEQRPNKPEGFINALRNAQNDDVLKYQSLDAYLFLRYLKICAAICLVGYIITWPILLPVNATGGAANVEQLDVLTMAKISNTSRYYAHALMAWLFFGFVIFVITRESIYFVNLRFAYLCSTGYRQRISSRVVLVTDIPKRNAEQKIRNVFPRATRVWRNADCQEIINEVKKRDKLVMKLENAEIDLCRTAYGKFMKNVPPKRSKTYLSWVSKKNRVPSEPSKRPSYQSKFTEEFEMDDMSQTTKVREDSTVSASNDKQVVGSTVPKFFQRAGSDVEAAHPVQVGSFPVYRQWITANDRPTHRPKFLLGQKVDTINCCQRELLAQVGLVRMTQSQLREDGGKLNSAFVRFPSMSDAQIALQRDYSTTELNGIKVFTGIQPSDVVWKNMGLSRSSRRLKSIAATVLIMLMIILWAIPVAVVGAISNINFLTDKVHFLSFINDIPSPILGVVTGLLPVVLLSILMSFVPVVCRMLARFSGAVSEVQVELWCQQWYFAFNVIQVFLVVTLASGATTVVTKIIADPSSWTSLLENNLPGASNFYISYFILQGLSIFGMALLRLGRLAGHAVLHKIFDKTPRKQYLRKITHPSAGWGSIYPQLSLFAMIAIVYSCIAPIVLGFAFVGFLLMYLAFKYNFSFVYTTVKNTNGAAFPRALQHLMVGVYFAELCLLGLFSIKVAVGPIVLMGLLITATIVYHILLNLAINPLLEHIPLAEMYDRGVVEGGDRAVSNRNSRVSLIDPIPPRSIPALYNFFKFDFSKLPSEPDPNANIINRYFHVNRYSRVAQLAEIVPDKKYGDDYSQEIEDDSYLHPAIKSSEPTVWIARDNLGLSEEEIFKTIRFGLKMSDDHAILGDNNRVFLKMGTGQKVPIAGTEGVVY